MSDATRLRAHTSYFATNNPQKPAAAGGRTRVAVEVCARCVLFIVRNDRIAGGRAFGTRGVSNNGSIMFDSVLVSHSSCTARAETDIFGILRGLRGLLKTAKFGIQLPDEAQFSSAHVGQIPAMGVHVRIGSPHVPTAPIECATHPRCFVAHVRPQHLQFVVRLPDMWTPAEKTPTAIHISSPLPLVLRRWRHIGLCEDGRSGPREHSERNLTAHWTAQIVLHKVDHARTVKGVLAPRERDQIFRRGIQANGAHISHPFIITQIQKYTGLVSDPADLSQNSAIHMTRNTVPTMVANACQSDAKDISASRTSGLGWPVPKSIFLVFTTQAA